MERFDTVIGSVARRDYDGDCGDCRGVRLCIVVFGMGYVIKLSLHGTETKTALYRRFISRDGAW